MQRCSCGIKIQYPLAFELAKNWAVQAAIPGTCHLVNVATNYASIGDEDFLRIVMYNVLFLFSGGLLTAHVFSVECL